MGRPASVVGPGNVEQREPAVRALIIGAGSVGLGVASCLLKSGQQTHLVGRQITCAALETCGLVRTGLFGEYRCLPGAFEVSPDVGSVAGSAFNYVLVCVKSYDSQQVAADLGQRNWLVPAGARVVLFQNGYGNVELFSAALGPERVYAARVITGFRRLSPHHVDITVHAAPVHVGSFLPGRSDLVADLCEALTAGDLPARVSHHIDADLWAKILYNAMLNPLGALLDATYGELGESPEGRPIMERIAAEGYAVMRASGHRTHWPDVGAFLEAFYEEMLPPTGEHESSMLQSIRNGQRTEIDALNGALAKLGCEYSIDTPYNEMITALVRHLEAGGAGTVSRHAQ